MNHSGMETKSLFAFPVEVFLLRKNHSGMETERVIDVGRTFEKVCCVRTIVVWKHHPGCQRPSRSGRCVRTIVV